jgi:hypothetical protein
VTARPGAHRALIPAGEIGRVVANGRGDRVLSELERGGLVLEVSGLDLVPVLGSAPDASPPRITT